MAFRISGTTEEDTKLLEGIRHLAWKRRVHVSEVIRESFKLKLYVAPERTDMDEELPRNHDGLTLAEINAARAELNLPPVTEFPENIPQPRGARRHVADFGGDVALRPPNDWNPDAA